MKLSKLSSEAIRKRRCSIQKGLRIFTALSFVIIGILHFTHASIFVGIMPPYLPWHLELVWISGAFEILGGIGLIIPQTRRFSAWGLLALLIAVFPANLHMAFNGVFIELPIPQSQFGLWLRLPLQGVIALQIWFTGLYTFKPSVTEET